MNIGDLMTEAAGWLGAGCLILAYALLSTGRIRNGPTYQLLNLAGAVGLAVNAVVHRAFPSAGLNLVWLAIGLFALGRLHRNGSPREAQLTDGPGHGSVPAANTVGLVATATSLHDGNESRVECAKMGARRGGQLYRDTPRAAVPHS